MGHGAGIVCGCRHHFNTGMPLFEYIGPRGEVVELQLHRPQDFITVDGKRYRRAQVHRVSTTGLLHYPTQKEEVRRGYHRMEEKGGRWPSDYSKQTIRKAWEI